MLKLAFAELGLTRQYSNVDLDIYVRRLRKKAVDYCDTVDEEMLADVCLHGVAENTGYSRRTCPSPFSKLL